LEVSKADWFGENRLHPAYHCVSLRRVSSIHRQQNDRAGRIQGSDGSDILEATCGHTKVRQDGVRRYIQHLFDGSIPIRRFGNLQSEVADDITQQVSHLVVVVNHQHQFPLVIALNRHAVPSFPWMRRTSRDQSE
jgi:hypothetical protein